MSYAIQSDLVSRFGELELIQLTDRDNTGIIDSVVLDAALSDASAEMDGYLAGVVALPLASVPRVLVGYCADIARYKLSGDTAMEQVRKRYEDAIKFLALVGQGKLSLGLDPVDAPAPAIGGVKSASGDRVFGPDNLAGY